MKKEEISTQNYTRIQKSPQLCLFAPLQFGFFGLVFLASAICPSKAAQPTRGFLIHWVSGTPDICVHVLSFRDSPCCCCLFLIQFKALSMVVAFDSNSSFTKCVSLNNSIACSFSLLSSEVSSISNACLIIVSNALRHTWYCSGKCSVTYSLMDSLAWLRRYCISKLIDAFDTCNSRAISVWLTPGPQLYYLDLRHSNCSIFVLKV